MGKLKKLKNYHLGTGFLIIALQILFQISNTIYLWGIDMILLSLYSIRVLNKLFAEKDNIEKIQAILAHYKKVYIFIIIPLTLLINLLVVADTVYKTSLYEMIYDNPILWINSIGICFIILHFLINIEINEIEKEVFNI